MMKRTLVITAAAAAFGLGLGASATAEAGDPWGRIAKNGTQLTGIALQGVTLDGCTEPQGVDVVIPKSGRQEPKPNRERDLP